MLRKITVFFISIVMALLLCSCDSEGVKQAKEAYAGGDFAKAVELLSAEEELSQDSQDLLIESEANVLYEKGEYFEAVKKLVSSSKGIQEEQFEDMYKAALDDSIAKHSADNVLELLAMDESKADAVYKAVTKACKDKDYNGFLVLDGLIEKMDDCESKTKLMAFDEKNTNLRVEAYLIGKWQETDEQGLNRTIEVTMSGDEMIGIIVSVDDGEAYNVNDVYWNDFKTIDVNRITCNSISRGSQGDSNDNAAVGEIDYEKGTLHLHLTPSSNDYALNYYDTNWKRVE